MTSYLSAKNGLRNLEVVLNRCDAAQDEIVEDHLRKAIELPAELENSSRPRRLPQAARQPNTPMASVSVARKTVIDNAQDWVLPIFQQNSF